MNRQIVFGLALAALAQVSPSHAQSLDGLISQQAVANGLPESLVRRVIKIESGGNPRVVSAGNYGLMQIRLGTARGLGYTGSAAGLLDPSTNMTYAVRYLAGAYKVAGGNPDRAVALYQRGYYYDAKRQGMTREASLGGQSSRAYSTASWQPATWQPITSQPTTWQQTSWPNSRPSVSRRSAWQKSSWKWPWETSSPREKRVKAVRLQRDADMRRFDLGR